MAAIGSAAIGEFDLGLLVQVLAPPRGSLPTVSASLLQAQCHEQQRLRLGGEQQWEHLSILDVVAPTICPLRDVICDFIYLEYLEYCSAERACPLLLLLLRTFRHTGRTHC